MIYTRYAIGRLPTQREGFGLRIDRSLSPLNLDLPKNIRVISETEALKICPESAGFMRVPTEGQMVGCEFALARETIILANLMPETVCN